MSDLADASREAMAWTLVQKAVAELTGDARARLLAAMEEAGALKQEVKENGITWGTASRTGGGEAAEVSDLDALTRWTAAHRPDMMLQVVNPKWVELLKLLCLERGAPFDPETGEVVPGIRLSAKPGGLVVRTNRKAETDARALVQQLALGNLELGGPDDS